MSNYFGYYESPIGLLEVITDEKYLLEVKFVDKIQGESRHPEILKRTLVQLDEYFKGLRVKFDLDYMLNGTDFQKSVWNALAQIPYGSVTPYKDIATLVGNPKACRAVGNANNKNKLSIIIPCHRVIGSNHSLTGYEWGLDRKQWLIDFESQKATS